MIATKRAILIFLLGLSSLWVTACSGSTESPIQGNQANPNPTNPPINTPFQPVTIEPFTPTGSDLPAEILNSPTPLIIITNPPTLEPSPVIPPTEAPTEIPTLVPTIPSNSPIFDTFVLSVKNDNPQQVVGVYVEERLALQVVQQPANNPAFVSTKDGVATQFLMAFRIAGNIGLLAHNYLAGKLFYNLQTSDIAQLIYGDGNVIEFEISNIYQFQALSPGNPYSNFQDVSTGETLNANDLFYRVYGGDFHLTFQTCLTQGENTEWGRLFVIATPL